MTRRPRKRARKQRWDIALTSTSGGGVVMHRADCAMVRAEAEIGLPVATLLDCSGPLPTDIPWHTCLPPKP